MAASISFFRNGLAATTGYDVRVLTAPHIVTWIICAAALVAILIRPRAIAEWVWAVAGAIALLASTLLPLGAAAGAVERGFDVYLFLVGMMALSELARAEGVFDWLATRALAAARGSRTRLFVLVYAVGAIVTSLLSNDATAVVLTPAVFAALARTEGDPLPFLYICAFVANAASFVLPISNPANLVVFDAHLPRLGPWLAAFGLPSIVAIVMTFAMLYLVTRKQLRGRFTDEGVIRPLSRAGRVAFICVLVSAAILVAAASLGKPIGITTFALGALSSCAVALVDRSIGRSLLRGISWSIVPLVAGLFVIVAALDRSGVRSLARGFLHHAETLAPSAGNLLVGAVVSLGCNLLNNLPIAVVTGYALSA
ncbi:MAG TPA: SLC13 family permease, partial [Candidatus Baltobacteraceae bacterium]